MYILYMYDVHVHVHAHYMYTNINALTLSKLENNGAWYKWFQSIYLYSVTSPLVIHWVINLLLSDNQMCVNATPFQQWKEWRGYFSWVFSGVVGGIRARFLPPDGFTRGLSSISTSFCLFCLPVLYRWRTKMTAVYMKVKDKRTINTIHIAE